MICETPEEVIDWLRTVGKAIMPISMFVNDEIRAKMFKVFKSEGWWVHFVADSDLERKGCVVLKRDIRMENDHHYVPPDDPFDRTEAEWIELFKVNH